MSFNVDLKTMAIDMHKGDTGSFWVQLELDDGSPFVEGDVALFEVLRGDETIIHREFDLQPAEPDEITPGDGLFQIVFENEDTDQLDVTNYNTEIRVILNPTREDNTVITGSTVRTLVQSSLNLRKVYIDV